MPAFDCGDWRDFYKWSYGSNRHYTPDHYRVGYLTIAGARVFFDDPLFTQEYFSRVVSKGWILNLQKTVREASGMSFKESFRAIEENFRNIWSEEGWIEVPSAFGQVVYPAWFREIHVTDPGCSSKTPPESRNGLAPEYSLTFRVE